MCIAATPLRRSQRPSVCIGETQPSASLDKLSALFWVEGQAGAREGRTGGAEVTENMG